MGDAACSRTDAVKRLRKVGIALAAICACGWLIYGLISAVKMGWPPDQVALRALCPGGIFLLSAIIAWKWQPIGGVLLFLEGVLVLVGYPRVGSSVCNICLVIAVMGAPPLLAGALLLIGWGRSLEDSQSKASTVGAEAPKA